MGRKPSLTVGRHLEITKTLTTQSEIKICLISDWGAQVVYSATYRTKLVQQLRLIT